VHVVPVERDVDRAERKLDAAEVGDQVAKPLSEGHPARVDADESGALELGIALDDLVSDPRDCPAERVCIEEKPFAVAALFGRRGRWIWDVRSHQRLLSGLTGPI
jgi:hypothetical protein